MELKQKVTTKAFILNHKKNNNQHCTPSCNFFWSLGLTLKFLKKSFWKITNTSVPIHQIAPWGRCPKHYQISNILNTNLEKGFGKEITSVVLGKLIYILNIRESKLANIENREFFESLLIILAVIDETLCFSYKGPFKLCTTFPSRETSNSFQKPNQPLAASAFLIASSSALSLALAASSSLSRAAIGLRYSEEMVKKKGWVIIFLMGD